MLEYPVGLTVPPEFGNFYLFWWNQHDLPVLPDSYGHSQGLVLDKSITDPSTNRGRDKVVVLKLLVKIHQKSAFVEIVAVEFGTEQRFETDSDLVLDHQVG